MHLSEAEAEFGVAAETEADAMAAAEPATETEVEEAIGIDQDNVAAVATIRGSVDKQLQGWCVTLFGLFMQPFLAHSTCYVSDRSACKAAAIKLLFRMKKALQTDEDFADDRALWGYAALKFAERARWTLEGLDCPRAAAHRALLLFFKARSLSDTVIPPPDDVLLREYLVSSKSGVASLGAHSLSAAHVSVLAALQNLRRRVCCRDRDQCIEDGGGVHVVSIGGGPGNDLAGALLWLVAPDDPETVTNRAGRRQRSACVASTPSTGRGAHASTSSSGTEVDRVDVEAQLDQSTSANQSTSTEWSRPVDTHKRKSMTNAMNLFQEGLNHSDLVDACVSQRLQLTVADLYLGWKPLVEATSRVFGVPISFVQCDVSRRLSDTVNKCFVRHVGLDEKCLRKPDDGAVLAPDLINSTAMFDAPQKVRNVQLVLFSFVLFESGSWRDFLLAIWRQVPCGSVFLFNDPKKFETAKVATFLSQSVADADWNENSTIRLLWAGTCLLVVKE